MRHGGWILQADLLRRDRLDAFDSLFALFCLNFRFGHAEQAAEGVKELSFGRLCHLIILQHFTTAKEWQALPGAPIARLRDSAPVPEDRIPRFRPLRIVHRP